MVFFSLISEYIQKYATAEALREPESESDSEMSDLSEDETVLALKKY